MNFKKWVKSIQTAGYNGARTVYVLSFEGITVYCELLLYGFKKIALWGDTTGWRMAKTTLPVVVYRTRAIITRGLYTFYPLFEVHLCTVTFGLMYG